MKNEENKQIRGFTLVELMVAVTIVVVMMALTLPNIPGMLRQQRMSSAKNQIRAALSQAQAYAAREQKNAGIRFEKSAGGRQYMVLVEHEPGYDYDDGYNYVDGSASGNLVRHYSPRRYIPIPGSKQVALPTTWSCRSGTCSSCRMSCRLSMWL